MKEEIRENCIAFYMWVQGLHKKGFPKTAKGHSMSIYELYDHWDIEVDKQLFIIHAKRVQPIVTEKKASEQEKLKYQFLYLKNGEQNFNNAEEFLCSARNIKSACKKFLNKHSANLTKVDYEVRYGTEFIDISDMEGFENYI